MTSPEEAAELNRRCTQNRDDIVFLHELVGATNENVKQTNTKVDNLANDVGQLKTDVDHMMSDVTHLKTDVGELKTDVSQLKTDVGRLDSQVGGLTTRVEERFDRLEQLIALPPKERDARTQNPLRTPQEKRISLLETKMDVYNGRTSEHIEELARHNRIFDVYDERFAAQDRRFDTLDSQMSEVLSILRGKSA